LASVIGASGVIATLIVGLAGLPGPVKGLVFRTSHDPAAHAVTLKVAGAVGALFIAILALGRFELSRNEGRRNAHALDYSEQTLYEGQYSRAVEQLAKGEPMIQLGAIYSLGLLYQDSARHRMLVVRALCAFIRLSTSQNQPTLDSPGDPVAAAVGVLREFDGLPIGLELTGAQLDYISMDSTRMYLSELGRAHLRNATLTNVDMTWSNLRGCDLTGTDLSGSVFDWCNLTDAKLSDVTAGGASFCDAVLTRADFTGAVLHGADFLSAVWDADGPPVWPAGFSPPDRAISRLTFTQLDTCRKQFIQDRLPSYALDVRFSGAALRERDTQHRRAAGSAGRAAFEEEAESALP